MSSATNQYIRQVLHHTEPPPPVEARFFYASPIPIDDPLSPLPPPTSGNVSAKQPPKAFSEYDNAALNQAWHELRRKILRYTEEQGEKLRSNDGSRSRAGSGSIGHGNAGFGTTPVTPRSTPGRLPASSLSRVGGPADGLETQLESLGGTALGPETASVPDTTGTPFIRAPSRKNVPVLQRDETPARPKAKTHDTYQWDDTSHLVDRRSAPEDASELKDGMRPQAKVPVGVSRLHQVEMPDLQMTPIYWTPVHDEATVVRGTWFYQDTMLPVEPTVANMLEAGYVDLQCWTETWKDELNSVSMVR